jgi:hypothetical protein
MKMNGGHMKLILIEGIPGSGKTTLAENIKDYYETNGMRVMKYQEGHLHPVDLAWCSIFSEEEYDHVLIECSEVKDALIHHTKRLGEQYVVGYTNIGLPMKDPRIKTYFEPKEVYGGRVDAEVFIDLHQKLWSDFFGSNHDEDIAIFECAYLQNHVNEMMLMYDYDEESIIRYVTGLIPQGSKIDVELIYLDNENVRETIERVAAERVSSDKSKWDDWIDLVLDYIKNSRYGEINKCSSLEDVYTFFEKRVKLEHKILTQLDFPVHVINNPGFDFNLRLEKIKAIL